MKNTTQVIKAAIEEQQMRLAGVLQQEEKLALIAIDSFITAFNLLRPAA